MNMNLATYKALGESIEHWERVVEEPAEELIGMGKCALCRMYNPFYGRVGGHVKPSLNYNPAYALDSSELRAIGCKGCPVVAKTGLDFCKGTPYETIDDLNMEDDMYHYTDLAERELTFLRSLLPQEGEVVCP